MRCSLLVLASTLVALPALAATPEGPRAPGTDTAAPAPASTAPASSTPASTTPATATPTVTPREQQLLERIQQLKGDQWRSFGVCRYAWARWRMGENGVRLTEVQCGPDGAQKGTVAVHCDSLRINRKMAESNWETWRLPLTVKESTASGGEDLMVASLCANIKPTATPAPTPAATPAPTPAAAPKP